MASFSAYAYTASRADCTAGRKDEALMAQFTNRAQISYSGVTADSNIVTGEIRQVLAVSKASVSGTYRRGDILTYAVSITNSGTTEFSGLTLSDDLGAYALGSATAVPLTFTDGSVLYYVNGVMQASPTVAAGPPLTVSGISVPAGGSAVIVYRATVNDYAAPSTGGSIVNTATVSGGGLSSALTASRTVTADTAAVLSITKSLSPTVVAENGQINYTFTIQNTGAEAADAAAALTVTDTFDPILKTPLTVTLNSDALAQSGNYTYNAATGEFATVPGVLTVPAATFTQDTATGRWSIAPGVTTLTVSGNI